MSESSDNPNRIHPRAPIELQVEYKKLNTFFSDYTKNISKGGTFIKTDRPLKVGTEFVFRLKIPAMLDPVEIKGRVAWVNTQGETQRPEIEELGMGIRFVYASDTERQAFEKIVEDMIRKSLGDVVYQNLMARSK
jgi:type IV pilus assembly protein PilZ